MTHEIFGQVPGSRVSWASEIMFFSGQHGAPTIDAIGHIGRDLKLHGGVDAVAATSTPGGIGANLGIDSFPVDLMINRGVFLDVARHVAAGAADPLPPGYEITAKHLDDTAKAQGVDVRKADSVLIRTGWGQYFRKDNARYLGEPSPGPGQDGAKWIIGHGARLAGDVVPRDPAVRGRPCAPAMRLRDPVLALTFLAAHTSRGPLAAGVITLPRRQAVVIAMPVASLGVLSSGRVIFGVGVGWCQPE